MFCVSRSRLGRGGQTQFCVNFLRYRTGSQFRSGKKSSRNGSGSDVPSKTSRHRPPTASKRGSKDPTLVEHTSSKFGHDPWPVRRGLVAAVKWCVRKARFFAVGEQNERSQSLVWVSTPQRGKPVLFSVFRSHICSPYFRTQPT